MYSRLGHTVSSLLNKVSSTQRNCLVVSLLTLIASPLDLAFALPSSLNASALRPRPTRLLLLLSQASTLCPPFGTNLRSGLYAKTAPTK